MNAEPRIVKSAVGAKPKLSVVVPALNEEASIGACLRSLAEQDVAATLEVIVVDNGSTDATQAVALSASSGLELRIVTEARRGRGAARCAGFAAARGDIVFSADADAVYPKDWMSTLLTALADEQTVAATGTARIKELSAWRNRVFNVAQPLVMWCYRFAFGHHCLSGFSFAIRRDAYLASGGFDPTLNAEEDADLSRRVARLGTIRLTPAVVTFSGRRFRRGLLRGLMDYVVMSARYVFRRSSATLSDVR